MPKREDALERDRARFAKLDPLLQHRSRLGALVLLSRAEALAFSRLRELLAETDGNLGAHLRKLEEAGYVAVRKTFIDRKPVSWYALTKPGRAVLNQHLNALQEMISEFKNGSAP